MSSSLVSCCCSLRRKSALELLLQCYPPSVDTDSPLSSNLSLLIFHLNQHPNQVNRVLIQCLQRLKTDQGHSLKKVTLKIVLTILEADVSKTLLLFSDPVLSVITESATGDLVDLSAKCFVIFNFVWNHQQSELFQRYKTVLLAFNGMLNSTNAYIALKVIESAFSNPKFYLNANYADMVNEIAPNIVQYYYNILKSQSEITSKIPDTPVSSLKNLKATATNEYQTNPSAPLHRSSFESNNNNIPSSLEVKSPQLAKLPEMTTTAKAEITPDATISLIKSILYLLANNCSSDSLTISSNAILKTFANCEKFNATRVVQNMNFQFFSIVKSSLLYVPTTCLTKILEVRESSQRALFVSILLLTDLISSMGASLGTITSLEFCQELFRLLDNSTKSGDMSEDAIVYRESIFSAFVNRLSLSSSSSGLLVMDPSEKETLPICVDRISILKSLLAVVEVRRMEAQTPLATEIARRASIVRNPILPEVIAPLLSLLEIRTLVAKFIQELLTLETEELGFHNSLIRNISQLLNKSPPQSSLSPPSLRPSLASISLVKSDYSQISIILLRLLKKNLKKTTIDTFKMVAALDPASKTDDTQGRCLGVVRHQFFMAFAEEWDIKGLSAYLEEVKQTRISTGTWEFQVLNDTLVNVNGGGVNQQQKLMENIPVDKVLEFVKVSIDGKTCSKAFLASVIDDETSCADFIEALREKFDENIEEENKLMGRRKSDISGAGSKKDLEAVISSYNALTGSNFSNLQKQNYTNTESERLNGLRENAVNGANVKPEDEKFDEKIDMIPYPEAQLNDVLDSISRNRKPSAIPQLDEIEEPKF